MARLSSSPASSNCCLHNQVASKFSINLLFCKHLAQITSSCSHHTNQPWSLTLFLFLPWPIHLKAIQGHIGQISPWASFGMPGFPAIFLGMLPASVSPLLGLNQSCLHPGTALHPSLSRSPSGTRPAPKAAMILRAGCVSHTALHGHSLSLVFPRRQSAPPYNLHYKSSSTESDLHGPKSLEFSVPALTYFSPGLALYRKASPPRLRENPSDTWSSLRSQLHSAETTPFI